MTDLKGFVQKWHKTLLCRFYWPRSSNLAKHDLNQGGEIQPLLSLHISPYIRKKKLTKKQWHSLPSFPIFETPSHVLAFPIFQNLLSLVITSLWNFSVSTRQLAHLSSFSQDSSPIFNKVLVKLLLKVCVYIPFSLMGKGYNFLISLSLALSILGLRTCQQNE